ncbi:hypothetical protein [Cryobacterium sp. Y62]|uniref:hypothetical protein n=1 Tax=Cryobacterium sp. Y62 TaxID=2048284 RepID=UPI0011B0AC12|nr:hypothetical protein [Cryobacterium sp. Y62]
MRKPDREENRRRRGLGKIKPIETYPDEMVNVAERPDYQEVQTRMAVALWTAQVAVGDAPHPDQPRPTDML